MDRSENFAINSVLFHIEFSAFMEDASGLITRHATDALLDGRAKTLGD